MSGSPHLDGEAAGVDSLAGAHAALDSVAVGCAEAEERRQALPAVEREAEADEDGVPERASERVSE